MVARPPELRETQSVVDRGSSRRYFSCIPHMVTDALGDGLSTSAFALYVYYRRHCGEHGGAFEESVRATARRTGMSVGSVHQARDLLVERGLIELHLDGPVGHEKAQIWIEDVWPENMEKYRPKSRDGADERSNSERKPRRSEAVASGDSRTQTALCVRSPLNASVQIVNAPIRIPEKTSPEEPEEREPEESASRARGGESEDDRSLSLTDDDGGDPSPGALPGLVGPVPGGGPEPPAGAAVSAGVAEAPAPVSAAAVEAWDEARELLREALAPSAFSTFVERTTGYDLADGILTVQPANPFHAGWLTQRCGNAAAQAAGKVLGQRVRVVFLGADPPEAPARELAAATGATR